jgi:hypothetical protein
MKSRRQTVTSRLHCRLSVGGVGRHPVVGDLQDHKEFLIYINSGSTGQKMTAYC